MTTFLVVNADTPEPDPVEKPVELKLEINSEGNPHIWAKQNGPWVDLAYASLRHGTISFWNVPKYNRDTLPGLVFDENGRWRDN